MSSRRSSTLLIACASLLLGGLAAVHSSELQGTRENPGLQLSRPLHGADALRAAGPRFNSLAALNRKTPHELAQTMLHDPDLWLDSGGRLMYTCQAPDAGAIARGIRRQAAARAAVAAPAPPFPVDTTFTLHSRPNSTRTLYLDFDGYVTSGTPWNSNIGDFTSTPFDLDGNANAWSSAEYESIQRVWQRMAEDYAAFDVDVTTEDPGVEALRKTGPSDVAYGMRVVFSPTDAWIGQNPPGGIAYIGSFDWDTDVPCFVFTDNVANIEKYMADAGSHEGGHTLGLGHDGTASLGYYSGQGNWGPIMGAPYDVPLTQWNNGDYASANNQEDDVAVMGTYGVNLTDDFGSAITGATNLTGTSIRVNGVISRRTDADVFRFQTGAGPITISAAPYLFGPNLDIQIELLTATGTVLATANPATLDASIRQSVAAGAYYVRVDGVGAGDALTTGYSDYGSIGYYQLDLNVTPAVAPVAPSNLVATALTSTQISLSWSDNSSSEDGFEVERKHHLHVPGPCHQRRWQLPVLE
ncbi:MAG: hypothetical protein K0Q72_433 [Armatimonadetes bacterium]|nr:hypothetical protein [Armatimonadota bacterium]